MTYLKRMNVVDKYPVNKTLEPGKVKGRRSILELSLSIPPAKQRRDKSNERAIAISGMGVEGGAMDE